ncbi:hypothetical protein VP01_2434g5 [Puccinia sorghi]|uniref:Uncharacterized protein n=1 Tax=Puccinia sorghi TaxID=27349 RepID=A0A0L6V714_9BASI|nr:hypothetical protein VP01_2434g5 [Puccinia sorghi]
MAKNGKLKASEWHTLFSIHLPLAWVDVLIGQDVDESLRRNVDTIRNLSALIQCTNVISKKNITKDDPLKFATEYNVYAATSKKIFPELRILPNHHYSLHIPKQLEWWGPLMTLSEFPGERLIGLLQKCKNNANPKPTGLTMMNKFCQLQRLKAQRGLDCALEGKETITCGSKFEIEEAAYNGILHFCQRSMPDLCLHFDGPHPRNSIILSNCAREISHMECEGGRWFSQKSPNDIVQYFSEGETVYGQVIEIIELKAGVNSILVKVLRTKEVVCNKELSSHL